MSETLTGNSTPLEEAVKHTDMVIVGRLLDLGSLQPGAPGEIYYYNAKVNVVRVLKGRTGETADLSLSFTVQRFPPEKAEEAPKNGGEYLFFIKEANKRAVKISQATQENIDRVKAVIR